MVSFRAVKLASMQALLWKFLMKKLTDQSVGQRKDVPGQYIDIARLQGNIRYIALQWPLIRPRKVLHKLLWVVTIFGNTIDAN